MKKTEVSDIAFAIKIHDNVLPVFASDEIINKVITASKRIHVLSEFNKVIGVKREYGKRSISLHLSLLVRRTIPSWLH